jgi:hypothetical protein
MTYESSRQALRELGRDARFENDIGHYHFRRWAANEVNRMLLVERNLMKPSRFDNGNLLISGLTIISQGISPARRGKGCLAGLATRSSKSITNHKSLGATSSMSFFFDPHRKVYYAPLEACSGKWIH